jgi:hypothetical protein
LQENLVKIGGEFKDNLGKLTGALTPLLAAKE